MYTHSYIGTCRVHVVSCLCACGEGALGAGARALAGHLPYYLGAIICTPGLVAAQQSLHCSSPKRTFLHLDSQ